MTVPPPFPHHSESPDCSITGMSSLPPANVLFHSAHSLPPQVITKNICSCKSWYFINRSITFATPQNPLSIPSINTNWPYAAANTTIHRLVAAKESSTGKVQAKTMHHGIGFKPTENISKNTSWKLNMPVNTINLIFFYVIFWNGGNKNVLNHSCQNALLLHICNRLGLEHSASKWGCTIRTDRDRSNQEICQKTTPWLDHTDPVLYQLRILYPAAADGIAAIMALQGSNGSSAWDQMTATSALMTALHFCMRPKRRCNNCYSWI